MRDRLVEAAVRVLAIEGPGAVQARRLTREIGASTIAVYHYFGGMPQLLRAVCDEGFRRLDAHLAAVAVTDDPITDIACLGFAYRAARVPQLMGTWASGGRCCPWPGSRGAAERPESVGTRFGGLMLA